jgi:hypothetical protein
MTFPVSWTTGPPARFHPSLRTAGEIMAERRAADAARGVVAAGVHEVRTRVVTVTVTTVRAEVEAERSSR